MQLLGAVFRDTEIESLAQVCSSIGKHWGPVIHFFRVYIILLIDDIIHIKIIYNTSKHDFKEKI